VNSLDLLNLVSILDQLQEMDGTLKSIEELMMEGSIKETVTKSREDIKKAIEIGMQIIRNHNPTEH